MHLPIDKSDYGIAGLAMAYGWAVSKLMVVWLALPMWAQAVTQGLVTFALGIGTLTAQYFWRRYLRRRWPEEDRKEEMEETTHDH